MVNNTIIDCHTHIQTKELAEEYFKNRTGYAITMKALDTLIGNGNQVYEMQEFNNIFLCECIDVFSNETIEAQLLRIEANLKKYKIIGIKIYLGYQPIFADDSKLIPVYQFCKKHKLSAVFHCGVYAENLNGYKTKDYSSCVPVGKIAKMFPEVNFIISHFDYPNFEDCLNVLTNTDNVFTDISGTYENFNNVPYNELINKFVMDIKPYLNKFNQSEMVNKIMFGTDYFGVGSGFDAVEEYIETLNILFSKQYEHLYLFENCLNAYPKLREYI